MMSEILETLNLYFSSETVVNFYKRSIYIHHLVTSSSSSSSSSRYAPPQSFVESHNLAVHPPFLFNFFFEREKKKGKRW